MRCPLRMKAFDQPDTCDPECAWRMFNYINDTEACAIAVTAMMTEGENNPYRIGNDEPYSSLKDCKVPTDSGVASIMSVNAFIKKQTEHESNTQNLFASEADVRNFLGSDDSREKLEADVSTWIANEMGIPAKCNTEDAIVLQRVVSEWLDRQAKITRLDCFDGGMFYDGAKRRTDMQAKIDELTVECDKYKDAATFAKQRQVELEAETSELLEKITALEAERDQLNSMLAEETMEKAGATIERDLLREKCENQRKELRHFNDICTSIHCFTDENNEPRIGSITEYHKAAVKAEARYNSLKQAYKESQRVCDELCQCINDSLWHRAIDQMSADVRVEIAAHLEMLGCPVDPV